MNYYQARQVSADAEREDAGRWRYTCMNDGQIWAVGYCADCPGHDTPEEANEHQTQYVLDHRLRLDGTWSDSQHRCEAFIPIGGVNISGLLTSPPSGQRLCGKWTDRFADCDHRTFNLCDRHRNREMVARLLGTIGSSVSSW